MHVEIIVYFPPEQMLADINVTFTNNQKNYAKRGNTKKMYFSNNNKNCEAGSTFYIIQF